MNTPGSEPRADQEGRSNMTAEEITTELVQEWTGQQNHLKQLADDTSAERDAHERFQKHGSEETYNDEMISIDDTYRFNVEQAQDYILDDWNDPEVTPDEIKDEVIKKLEEQGHAELVKLLTGRLAKDWHTKE